MTLPIKDSTGCRLRLGSVIRKPRKAPYFVVTTRDDIRRSGVTFAAGVHSTSNNRETRTAAGDGDVVVGGGLPKAGTRRPFPAADIVSLIRR